MLKSMNFLSGNSRGRSMDCFAPLAMTRLIRFKGLKNRAEARGMDCFALLAMTLALLVVL